MECRIFEITLISANDIEDFRRLCRNKVYATVSVGGAHKKRTPTDNHGRSNPAWNFKMRFTVRESMVRNCNTMVVVKLMGRRRFGWDRYIGEVHTPLKELFDYATLNGGCATLNLNVMKGCVVSQGGVRFAYSFGEKIVIDKLLLAESVGGWIQC